MPSAHLSVLFAFKLFLVHLYYTHGGIFKMSTVSSLGVALWLSCRMTSR